MDGFSEFDTIAQNALRDRLDSTEHEVRLIGTVIMSPNAYDRVSWLSPATFTGQVTAMTWETMRDMRAKDAGAIFDPMILAPRLEAGGLAADDAALFVRECAKCAAEGAHVTAYAKSIRDLSVRKKFLDAALDALEDIGDMTVSGQESIAKLVGALQGFETGGRRRVLTKREVASEIVKALDEQKPVYSTGLRGVDEKMGGGLYAGKSYGIAARKKVGKSLLIGSMSHNLDAAGVPHLVVAMETPSTEMEQRNIAADGGFNSVHFLKRDNVTLDMRVCDIASKAGESARYFDCPGATYEEIRSEILREIVMHGIKGVFVDYLQLVQGKAAKETEEYHTRQVAQGLADLARDEGIFVVMAAQVNQEGNTRGGEGLRLACDQYYTLNREKDQDGAWMEMGESRYTAYANVGNEFDPGLILSKHGPKFIDP